MNEIIQLSTERRTLARNQLLKTGSKINDNIYYVESGSVRIFTVNEMDEQVIRFGYKGSLFVLLDSFFTGKPSVFQVQAIKKTELSVITKPQLEVFLNSDQNRKIWISILENLIVQQLDREIDLLSSSPLERYQRVLERSPALFQEIPNKHIANYLRMSPETLSRLKKS